MRERWTLLLVRELMVGPKRYGELLDNLAGIGTNLLADRLRDMESSGLIEKHGQRYCLTAMGRCLEPVVLELIRFGLGLAIPEDPERLTRAEWDTVALRALYRPRASAGLTGTYVIELDGQPFRIEQVDSDVRIATGDDEHARARVGLTKIVARELMAGSLTLDKAIRTGSIRIVGRRREARRLLAAFGLKR